MDIEARPKATTRAKEEKLRKRMRTWRLEVLGANILLWALIFLTMRGCIFGG